VIHGFRNQQNVPAKNYNCNASVRGNDTSTASANRAINLGNGNDTVIAGASDTIFAGKGTDIFEYGVGSSPPNATINRFNPASDVIQFNVALLVNYAVAMQDTKQVGLNTVIQKMDRFWQQARSLAGGYLGLMTVILTAKGPIGPLRRFGRPAMTKTSNQGQARCQAVRCCRPADRARL
jgi:hypothetical protein